MPSDRLFAPARRRFRTRYRGPIALTLTAAVTSLLVVLPSHAGAAPAVVTVRQVAAPSLRHIESANLDAVPTPTAAPTLAPTAAPTAVPAAPPPPPTAAPVAAPAPRPAPVVAPAPPSAVVAAPVVASPPIVRRNALTSPDGSLNTGVGVYSDCSGQTPLGTGAAAIDTCIPGRTFFVGHNPGVFSPLMGMGIGSRITWYDGAGTAHPLMIVAIRVWQHVGLPPAPINGGTVQFQACITADGSVNRLLDAAPA